MEAPVDERRFLVNARGNIIGAFMYNDNTQAEIGAIYLFETYPEYFYSTVLTKELVGEVGDTFEIGAIYN